MSKWSKSSRPLRFPRVSKISKISKTANTFKSFQLSSFQKLRMPTVSKKNQIVSNPTETRICIEYASLLHNCSPTRRGFPFELPSCSLSGRISLDKSTSLHNLVKFCATRSTRVERQRGGEREGREWMAIGENGVGARGTGTTSELNPIRSTWLCGFASLPQIESPAGYYVSMFTIWRPAIPPLCA